MSATIRIAILANAAAARAEIESVSRASQDMDGTLARVGSKMGTVLKAGAAAGAIGLLGLAKQGLSTAADMEQAEISFSTMLGSGAKAKAFIADLSKFAAQTPFDFPGLQEASSSLISAGVDSQKVIPIMKTLGDVTSGMGTGAEGIQRATVALQQMQASQKISGEDLAQLRDAGIPVYDLLASSIGKSKQEVVELANKGKLGKKELDALMKGLETGKGLERFNGLMQKQSQSLTGVMSTLKDNFSQGLAQAIAPAIPKIKQIVGDIGNALPGIFAGVISFFKAVMPTVSAAFDVAKVAVQALFTVLENPVFQSFAAGVLAIMAGLKVYAVYQAIVTGLTTAWTAAQALLNLVMTANPIGIIILAIVGFVAAIVVAYKRSETFRAIVQAVWAAIQAAVLAVVNWFTTNIPKLWTAAQATFTAIKTVATTIWNAVQAVINVVITAVTAYINAYKAVVTAVWNTIKNGAVTAWNAISGAVKTVVDKVTSFVQGLRTSISNAFSNAASILINAGRDIINGLWNGLKEKWEAVKAWFSGITKQIPNLKGPASKDATLLRRSGQLVIGGFLTGLESRYGTVQSSLAGFTNSLSTSAGFSGSIDVTRPLAANGVQSAPAAIVIDSAGSRMDDLILEVLRRSVRAGGGNVQTVLGRG